MFIAKSYQSTERLIFNNGGIWVSLCVPRLFHQLLEYENFLGLSKFTEKIVWEGS